MEPLAFGKALVTRIRRFDMWNCLLIRAGFRGVKYIEVAAGFHLKYAGKME
jgi:hypothetical protein